MILSLVAPGAVAGATEQAPPAKRPAMSEKMTKPHDHMAMAAEPHHVLAMAYHQNLVAFAKALSEQTESAGPVNLDFARAAVGEMRRSFDQMKQHHEAHMQGMPADMHARMDPKTTEMMAGMEAHRAEMNTQLTALEKEVALSAPDAKTVSGLAAKFQGHLTKMSAMHAGC